MLESSVDRFGGAVGEAGVIEVGQDVGAPFGQGSCQDRNLLLPVRTAGVMEQMSCCIRYFPRPGSPGAVGTNQAPVSCCGS